MTFRISATPSVTRTFIISLVSRRTGHPIKVPETMTLTISSEMGGQQLSSEKFLEMRAASIIRRQIHQSPELMQLYAPYDWDVTATLVKD